MISYFGSALLLACAIFEFGKGQSCSTDGLSVVLNTEVSVYPTVNRSLTIPLYFGLMVSPSENNDYLNSTVTAVQIALENINDDPNLLGGYSLHYTLTTSQCSENDLVDKTLGQLFEMSGKCRLGLIEAGCTDRRESLARTHLVNHFNISQITCSPTVQDSTDDVSIFEVSPANDVIVPALVKLIAHNNWKQLALVVENRQDYSQIMGRVLGSLNLTLIVTSLSVENHTLKVEDDCNNKLFNQDARIIVLLMSSEVLRYFICEAYKSNIKYPKYEFILVSNHDSDWWVASPLDDLHYGCSSEQRAQVLNYSLALQWRPDYTQRLRWLISKQLNADSFKQKDAAYCHDAVWTLALAVNKTLSEFSNSVLDCEHSDWPLFSVEKLHQNIRETNINDVTATGRIEFGPNGERKYARTEVLVKQYQRLVKGRDQNKSFEQVNVGLYSDGNLSLLGDALLWPRGVPYDGSRVTVLVTVSLPLTIVYYLIATAGIILTIACCVFNFTFRKTKIIRLTSPNLNYLLITGILFIFISVYWHLLPSTTPGVVLTTCCLHFWFFTIGTFLSAGTIAAKVWRIYYIFRNPNSTKKYGIKDFHLFVFVLALVAIATVILLVYTAVEAGSPGYDLATVPNDDHLSAIVGELSMNEHYYFYTCNRVPNAKLVTKISLYAMGTILLGSALFMAFKTRKVKVKNLNDAKYITAIVYISSLVNILHLVINFSFGNRVNAFPAVLSGLNMATITGVLLLVFLPKMITLYRDPRGEHVFSFDDANCKAPKLSSGFVKNKECTGCLQLLEENKRLRQNLDKINNTFKENSQENCDIESREADLCDLNSCKNTTTLSSRINAASQGDSSLSGDITKRCADESSTS